MLFGVKAFFKKHNALDKTMQDIVNEDGFQFSACELTKSTGLSLTETLVREAYREAGEGEGMTRCSQCTPLHANTARLLLRTQRASSDQDGLRRLQESGRPGRPGPEGSGGGEGGG